MTIRSKTLRAIAAVGVLVWLALPAAAKEAVAQRPAMANFAGAPASADARYAAAFVMASGDNEGLPFVIVDKKNARIFVFGPEGQLRGASAALLGLAPGDHSVPGVGDKDLSRILPEERTTPAGRFISQPGRNLQGEHVVWVNYREGLAIHRLRPDRNQANRTQRLASRSTEDNRISLGCVVVPVAFYESVISPFLGNNRSVVYVLPETRPAHALFSAQAL